MKRYMRPVNRKENEEFQALTLLTVQLHERLTRVGLLQTAQHVQKAVESIGWEIADKREHGMPVAHH